MNAEQVGAVADNHQTANSVGVGDYGNPSGGVFCVAALGFGDDVFLGNPQSRQVLESDGAFGVPVAAGTTQGNNERGNAAMVKREGVIEARAVDRGRLAIVLRRTKDADRVGRLSLIPAGVGLNL